MIIRKIIKKKSNSYFSLIKKKSNSYSFSLTKKYKPTHSYIIFTHKIYYYGMVVILSWKSNCTNLQRFHYQMKSLILLVWRQYHIIWLPNLLLMYHIVYTLILLLFMPPFCISEMIISGVSILEMLLLMNWFTTRNIE